MITEQGVAVPEDMAAALRADPAALESFERLRPSGQREFVDWLGRSGGLDRRQRLSEVAAHVRQFDTARSVS